MIEIKIPLPIVKALKANAAGNNDVRKYLQYALFDKENNALVATSGATLIKIDFDLSELPSSLIIKMPPAFFGEKKEITLKIHDDYSPMLPDDDYRQTESLLIEVGSEEILASEGNPNLFPPYSSLGVLATNLSHYEGANLCVNSDALAVASKTFGRNTAIRFFSKSAETGFTTDAIIATTAEEDDLHFDGSQLVIMPMNV